MYLFFYNQSIETVISFKSTFQCVINNFFWLQSNVWNNELFINSSFMVFVQFSKYSLFKYRSLFTKLRHGQVKFICAHISRIVAFCHPYRLHVPSNYRIPFSGGVQSIFSIGSDTRQSAFKEPSFNRSQWENRWKLRPSGNPITERATPINARQRFPVEDVEDQKMLEANTARVIKECFSGLLFLLCFCKLEVR